MRKRLFITLAVCFAFTYSLLAQDVEVSNPDTLQHEVKVPNLLITEFNFSYPRGYDYIEISNLEDTAVNLSDFSVHNLINYRIYIRNSEGEITQSSLDIDTRYYSVLNGGNYGRSFYFKEEDVIQAHSSIVIMCVFDLALSKLYPTTTIQSPEFVKKGDYFVHWKEANPGTIPYVYDPENQAFGFDSLSYIPGEAFAPEFLRGAQGPYILQYHYERLDPVTGDAIPYTILVDQIALAERETQDGYLSQSWSVAGVPDHQDVILVRKSSITKPNLNWHIARGISAEDSEWMVLPRPQGREPFTTIGNFGDYSIDISPKNEKVSINGNVITVPWEAQRFDDVIKEYVQLGDGMAFQYIKSSARDDSAYVRVREGDTLALYATGESLKIENFVFKVTDPTADIAEVFPKITTYGDENYYNAGAYIMVSDDASEMDTISNITFQSVIDSVLAYLEYPPKANAEYVYVDGDDERTEVVMGDKLRITSENGNNVKEYYIKVNDYVMSEDATLERLTFPEYELDADDYYWEWEDANVPGFGSLKTFMTFKVSPNRKTVPTLVPIAKDRNAKIKIQRAKNLVGSIEERTTTITVTAELDTISKVYEVVFEKEQDFSLVQKVVGVEPFISQAHRQADNGADFYVSIFNPNSDPIDLSRYMLLEFNMNNDLVESKILRTGFYGDTIPHKNDCYNYLIGYTYDFEKWKNGDKGYYKRDASVNTILGSNEEFVIGAYIPHGVYKEGLYDSLCNVNLWDPRLGDEDGSGILHGARDYIGPRYKQTVLIGSGDGLLLLKVLNDSLMDGTKIKKDVDDFEVVDMLARPKAGHPYYDFYQKYSGNKTNAFAGWFTAEAASELGVAQQYGQMDFTSHTRLRRKSRVQKGATTYGEGFHWDKDTCDWVWECSRFDDWKGTDIRETFHTHYMEPITSHLSTVTSSEYIVTPGFSSTHALEIKGVPAQINTSEFYTKINKSDDAQSLSIIRSGNEVASDDVLVSGDILKVYSADSANISQYTIIIGDLNNNTDLTAVGSLGVEVGTNTLSGFGYDTNIADVLAGVEAHALSIINVVDADNTPVSLFTLRYDQEIPEETEVAIADYIETKVFDGLFFEVVAENGDVKLYEITPTVPSDDIYLISNKFDVVEGDTRYIQSIPEGLAVPTLLQDLYAPGNADIKVYSASGYERTEGRVKWNDYVEVTSEDGLLSAQYYLMTVGTDVDSTLIILPVEEVLAGNQTRLYPNPAQDIVYLENVPEGSVVQVISLSGNVTFSSSNITEKMMISTTNFDKGIYLVRIVEKEGSTVLKLIVK